MTPHTTSEDHPASSKVCIQHSISRIAFARLLFMICSRRSLIGGWYNDSLPMAEPNDGYMKLSQAWMSQADATALLTAVRHSSMHRGALCSLVDYCFAHVYTLGDMHDMHSEVHCNKC